MLVCPTCAFENSDFSTVCVKCKGFLQNRVPNLNLFQTAWGIIEAPRATFRTIVLSEHKNYSVFLFVLFGISLSFTAFWYFEMGEFFETLLDLVPWALAWGIPAGVVLSVLLPLVYHGTAKALGGSLRFRDSLGLLAYSLVPITASLLLILPIELLTFGMYLFMSNPHPWVIKPVSYVLLVGFDALMGVWSLFLAIIATSIGHRFSLGKSSLIVAVVVLILGSLFFLVPPQILQAVQSAGEQV